MPLQHHGQRFSGDWLGQIVVHPRRLAALTVFRETVAGTLDENLELVQKSFASGKLRASEVLVFRREFVDSRRELIEAAADAWLAKIALDLTTGDTQHPAPAPDSTSSTSPETSR